MVDMHNFFREICAMYFVQNPIKLSAPGVIVQIDESSFSHKPKYHHGRAPASLIRVFGIVNTSTKPAVGYMDIIEERDAATLLPKIERIVRKRSMVHSNKWKAYSQMQGHGYKHRTVNHSLSFINPETGVNTQNIESYWNKQKSRIKVGLFGWKRSFFFNSYLQDKNLNVARSFIKKYF